MRAFIVGMFTVPRAVNELQPEAERARESVNAAVAAVERAVPADVVERTQLGALKRKREGEAT